MIVPVLAVVAVGALLVATVSMSRPTLPSNLVPMAYDLKREGLEPGTLLADAVLPATFPFSIGVSGWGFYSNPELQQQAFNILEETAWAWPEIVFLYYQDLQLSNHEPNEVAVMTGQFNKRVLDNQVVEAYDLESFKTALDNSVEYLSQQFQQ